MRDSASVIHDTDQRDTAVFYLHLHRCRACVNGVFDKLFYDRRRTFDHLTGSDLVDRHLIQYMYMGHIRLLS